MHFPPDPQIRTTRLTIRLLDRADLAWLLAVNGNDEVTRYLPYESWKGMADAESWHDRALARLANREAVQFVMAHRESGSVIGTCLLFHFDEVSGRAEVGYVLAQAFWGAGYMLEAMEALVAFAFEQMGLRRLEAELDPRNSGSSRLLERLGFVKEGHLRERWSTKGEVTDSSLYGLLRTQWRRTAEGG